MSFRPAHDEGPRHPLDVLADIQARQDLETIRGWECPTCGAIGGEKCIRPDGAYQQMWTHPARTRLAFPTARRTA